MAVSFKGAHFPPEIILMGVRWYLAYPLRGCFENPRHYLQRSLCENELG
jgi:hypothetical protein